MASRVRSLSDRFWSKVDRFSDPEGCWRWRAAFDSSGYGHIRFAGALLRAHRVAWELVNGEIPAGFHVLHKCIASRDCVNPAHLYLGTNAENVADRESQGRNFGRRLPKAFCRFGHARLPGSRKTCPTCKRFYKAEYRRQRKAGVSKPVVDLAALVAADSGDGSRQ